MRRLLKLLRIGPRIVFAFVAGSLIRNARRLLRRPPRIWHGFTPMFFTAQHVAADRRAGFPARSVVRHARLGKYDLVRARDFDVVYEDQGPTEEAHWRCLADLLRHGDIWYTHFESLFFRPDQQRMNELAMMLVTLAGIRIIVAPHGGDILHDDGKPTRYDWIGRAQRDYPQWDLVAQGEIARTRIALFSRFASIVIGGDHSLIRWLPRSDLFFPTQTVDTAALVAPPRERHALPRVIHAPNHRATKGTEYLIAAAERLRARGIECELVLVEQVARHEALQIYATADIIADQFIIGVWGVFAAEGMALGKPVLTYLDEKTLAEPVFNQPVVNTTPENLEQVLAVLLVIPELRARLGRAGRTSIERYQSVDALAQVWARVYRHVWWGEPLNLEETSMFSPERKPRVSTEDPSRAEFWPVEVGDLMPRIREAVVKSSSGSSV